jgi:serine/threonine protein kinase
MKLKEWKTVLFQIISVLAIIHSKYPAFRHNDMKANNILIHNIDINKKSKKFLYNINNQKYEIPDIGYQIKLWDFDFSCIPGIIDNSKVLAEWTNRINILPIQNRYYDIHYFFNTLIKKGFFPELLSAPEVPSKIKSFVNRILPTKYREGVYVAERGRILINEEYTIPDIILKNDPLFETFRIN